MPKASGARFTSAGGEVFFALSTVGANPSSDAAYDWGFSLLPEDGLTTEAVVGWGPGSSDGSQNGSPVWVTAPSATRVYVDYDGDRAGPLTDPNGLPYDVHYDLVALESRKIYDPDKDQTAMRLYTLDGTVISTAWGEDPDVASPGNPFLDFGTTVLPFPVPVLRKSSTIFTDNNPPGLSIGDVIEYTIELDNRGLLPLGNTVVIDAPSPLTAYVPSSTTLSTNAVPDDPAGTPYPLDAPGYNIPIILRGGTSVFKYRATVLASGLVSNTVSAAGYNLSAVNVIAPPSGGGPTQCSVNFSDAIGTTLTTYAAGDGIFVTLADGDANTVSNSAQTVSVVVRNLSRGDLETLTLTETGPNTGVFRNLVALPSSLTMGIGQQDGTLNVAPGDLLSVTYTDAVFADTCGANATVATAVQTKFLYLSDPAQTLDRVDPVAANDLTTASTAVLGGGSAAMIAVDAASQGATTTQTLTIPHTTGAGSDRLMLVGVSYDRDGGTVTNVTYNGLPLTRVADVDNTSGSVKPRVDIWQLVAPQSGAANVVINFSGSSSTDANAGVVTFTGVDQVTPTGTAATNISTGPGNSAATVTLPSAAGELVYDTVAVANNAAANAGPGQTRLWTTNTANIRGAGSTEPGAASVTMSWTNGSARWAIAAVSIKPATTVANSTATFTQAPAFCQPFTILSNRTITVTNFVTVTSGSMPVNPGITARLAHGGTNIVTLINPAYNSGAGTLVWSGTIANNVAVPAGSAIALTVSNAQAGVAYTIDFDSVSKPSKIALPTISIIHVDSLGVYDAPYPGGSLVAVPVAGSTLYVRATASDPFGSSDITSLGLGIDGPGTAGDLNVTLTNAQVVASDSCSKTYEYVWQTGSTVGNYDISATANEGTEGITDVAATAVLLTFLDLGTPSSAAFTSGDNGAATNQFATNQPVCVRVTDQDQNTNNAVVELLTVTVTSSAGDSELLTLTEAATNSGVFTGCLNASTTLGAGTNNGTLLAPVGSVLNASYADPDDGTDTSAATATVPTPPGVPGVSVTKTLVAPADAQAGVGEAVQFNLQVVNTGNTTLTNVALTDTYPAASLTFVSASLTPSATNSGSLTWSNVGPLTPGQSVNIGVNFTATDIASPALNLAAVNAGGGTTNGGSASVTITRSALSITKTLLNPTNGPVSIGSNVTFRIAITNTGTVAIQTLPLEDTFSAGCFQFVSATIAPDGAGAGSLFWADLTGAGTLAPGASYTIDVTMTVAGGCDPADNTARADYAVDANGDPVPSATGSVGLTTLAAKITGAVYNDPDQSGTLTAGDSGLQGVTVQLFTDPDGDGNPADGVLVRDLMTLADGSYELLNLASGTYVIVESDPPGFASSAPVNNRIATNVTSLTTFSNANFFDYLPNPVSYATVTGNVWDDANASGTRETNEVGVTNVTLDLVQDLNTNGVADLGEPIAASTSTGTNGAYSFANITPGAYVVRESDLFGWVSTGDALGANDNQIGLVLGSGAVTNGNDFLDFFTGNTIGNDPPVAVNDTYDVTEDVPRVVAAPGVLANDSDIDGDPITAVIFGLPTNGVVTLNTNGGFTYTPNSNFFGTDTFTYRASDGQTNSGLATVTLNVTPVNDAPVANSQSLTNAEDTPLPITLTGADVDGPVTNFTIVTPPASGTLTGTAPNVTYTPATNYSGPDSFTFTVNDGSLTSAVATVSITVTPVNDAPVAISQSVTNLENTPLPITLTGADGDGPVTNFTIAGPPANGTLSGTAPNVTYTPDTNYNGPDSFTFTVNDGSLTSAVATVSITVQPVNGAPVAFDQSLTNAEDTPLPVTLTGLDSDGPVTNFTVLTVPTNGTLRVLDTNGAVLLTITNATSLGSTNGLSYLPATNFFGPDSFTFVVDDGSLTSAVATVSLSVTNVNDAPTLALAIPDQAGTYGAAFSYAFPTNTFTDVDAGQTLTFTATNLPPGIAFDGATRTFSGTPTASGTFTVTVTATDNGMPALSASDTFDIVISPAALTVTADNQSRPFGATNPPLTYAFGGFVLGDTTNAVSGAPSLSTPATPASPVGTYPITVAAGSLSASNYTFTLVDGTLTVTGGTVPDVSWTPQGPIIYGTPLGTNQLNATSSVPGMFVYAPTNGAVLNTGTNVLNVVFTPSDTNTYSPVATNALLVVLPAPLTVTADNVSRLYGTTNPPLTHTFSGFVNGDSASNAVSGLPDLSTTATPSSPVGAYPIMVATGTLSASNYAFTLVNGTLTVTMATPLITWTPPAPIVYGTPLTTNQLNATSPVPGTFTYTPSNGVVLPAGSNNLIVVFTPTDTNYAPATSSVPLLVLKATLTARADDKSVAVGAPIPPLTITYTGFVNGDSVTNLDVLPIASTTATTNSPAGLSPITPAGGSDDNYTFNYVDGTLNVGSVAPTLEILRQINGFATFNPQTSLFEQTVRLTNGTTTTFSNVVIVVSNLPATVRLYNGSGTNAQGNPFVVVGTLAPGNSVTLLLEYFSENRAPFAAPTLGIEFIAVTPPPPPAGTVAAIDRAFMAANGRFYIEWNSQAGRTYYVQYGDSPTGPWKTVFSPIIGTGFRIVWIDDGPPKTENPGTNARFYQLIVQ